MTIAMLLLVSSVEFNGIEVVAFLGALEAHVVAQRWFGKALLQESQIS